MAVMEVTMLDQGLSGELSGFSINAAKRTHTAVYKVKSAPTDTEVTILEHFRTTNTLPYLGKYFKVENDRDETAICNSIAPQRVEKGGGIWLTTVKWSPLEDEKEQKDSEGNDTNNPLDWHDEVNIGFRIIMVPCEVAIFRGAVINGVKGQPIPPLLNVGEQLLPCNSAFVPFDPTLEQEINIKVVTITKNLRVFDGIWADQFRGCVNEDFVNIQKLPYGYFDQWQPLTAKVENVTGTFQLTNRILYWKQAVEVHINPLTWRKFPCDRGMAQRLTPGAKRYNGQTVSYSDPDVNQLEALRDQSGFPIAGPVLFNGKGQPLDPLTEKPVYLEYQVFPEVPFAPIPW